MTTITKEIKNRDDLYLFVTKFYNKLLTDKHLKHFFEHMVQHEHLSQHLEVITDFWNGILFDAPEYQGNVMQSHLDQSKVNKFKKHHFKAWLGHFNTTMNENFIGEKAELAKIRALSIATVMELKMTNP